MLIGAMLVNVTLASLIQPFHMASTRVNGPSNQGIAKTAAPRDEPDRGADFLLGVDRYEIRVAEVSHS